MHPKKVSLFIIYIFLQHYLRGTSAYFSENERAIDKWVNRE